MRKSGILFIQVCLLLFVTNSTIMGAGSEYLKYFRTDSAHVYSWNSQNQSWEPTSVQLYSYSERRIVSALSLNFQTRAGLARTDYFYYPDNVVSIEVNYNYDNGWVLSTRNTYYYDAQNRVSEIRIQKWSNSAWADDRIQKNYVYDEFDRQVEFQMIYWRFNAWTSSTTDYSYYTPEGRIIRREGIYPTGATDYQMIYTYDQSDLLSETYTQYPSSTGWTNWWLASYQYDPCGFKIAQVRYAGSGSNWIPQTKVVNFSYFKPDLFPELKAPMCHDGYTLLVKKTLVQVHLDHGDCLGGCPAKSALADKGADDNSTKNNDVPFTVFPNPASDRITVAPHGNDHVISRVELLDWNGNILKVVDRPDIGEITIFREGLISGQYILRIHGDRVFNMVVVFN